MTTNPPTREDADKLFRQLADQFTAIASMTDTLEEIIDSKAWVPLGHASFHAAWLAYGLDELTAAVELRPAVVYAMLEEGLDPDEIAEAVKGTGPATVEHLDRQRRHGVPADQATLRTRTQRPARPADTIRVKVGAGRLEEYHRLADLAETTVAVVALTAVVDAFDEIRARLGNPI